MKITEGISGTWFYHWSEDDNLSTALCGAKTMSTMLPNSYWNKTPPKWHIPEKWCKKCEDLVKCQ